MALVLKQAKVYFKLGATAVAALIVLLIIIMNHANRAKIWFFGTYEDINVLWLILVTAIISVLLWWGACKIFSVVREYKEMRRLSKEERQLQEQRRLNESIIEREKKIDEKIRRSITEE